MSEYWYYVYEWRKNTEISTKKTMDVFSGSFSDLILFALDQPENWRVIFAKEINEESYNELNGRVG